MHVNILLLVTVLTILQGCTGLSAGSAARVGENTAEIYSAGTQLDDNEIEAKASKRIREKYKEAVQVTVTSHSRAVLITGEVKSDDLKKNIERVVYSVPSVKKVTNEITIGALATPDSRRTDVDITNDVKYSLNKNKSIKAGVIRIVSDKSVVYLLGMVTHAEADAATTLVSTSPGVKKVVRAFEYID